MTPRREHPWTAGPGGSFWVHVHVQPRAKRPGIAGIHEMPDGPVLKVALQAPPLDGRANGELVELFARKLKLKRSAVTLDSGDKSRDKRLRIEGVDVTALASLAE